MRTNKLRIGDEITETDEFTSFTYVVTSIKGDKAIASTSYLGKLYVTAYRLKYRDPNQIFPYVDLRHIELPTKRVLTKRNKYGKHSKKSGSDNQ